MYVEEKFVKYGWYFNEGDKMHILNKFREREKRGKRD